MTNEPEIGQVWNVKPWWSNDAQIPCRVFSVPKSADIWGVGPLTGNPHGRHVNRAAFIDRIGGHPAETVA